MKFDTKIAGVIVLYNPDMVETLHNIKSCLPQVDKLFLIDNSDSPNASNFINDLNDRKIHYYYNLFNQGIANALNKGLQYARDYNFDWLLLLDQDSTVPQGYIDVLKQYIFFNETEKIGILAPIIKWGKNIEFPRYVEKPQRILTAITSGSLLNMAVANIVGDFEEFLFIDWVDIDYSLKMGLKGYHIIQLPNIHLIHQLGDCKEIRFFKKHIAYIGHHSSIRKYYATRNIFYIIKKYREFYPHYCRIMKRTVFTNLLKILFFENQKINKFRASFLGYIDFRKNIFGKISPVTLSKIN